MSTDDVHECPTCGRDDFQSDWGMRSHHKQVHGSDAISTDELLDTLRDLADELGRTPKMRDVVDRTPRSASIYQNRFGSWNEALKQAGLDVNLARSVERADLLGEIQALADRFGRPPTQEEMGEYGAYTPQLYHNKFGSWTDALAVLGMRPRGEYDKVDLFSELQRLAEELGRTPRKRDMDSHGQYSAYAYSNRFGSWNEALERAGFEPNLDHDVKTYFQSGYGEGWDEAKKEQVRERDGRQCVYCSRSEEVHIEKFGRKQAVHHISPADWVDDAEERNHPDNLITLCIDGCHQKWEGIPLRPDTPSLARD